MTRTLLMAVVCAGMLTAQAAASVPEGHKMHYPQYPDPNGWDVNITRDTMFDDWQCSSTGPVSDIHFWGSWQGDRMSPLLWIDIGIYADVAVDDANNHLTYSHPDAARQLWFRRFYPNEWIMTGPFDGLQGWFDPQPPVTVTPNDHQSYWKFDFVGFPAPFDQTEGTVYWLGIHAGPEDPSTALGWKTSLDHWNDDAVFYYSMEGTIPGEAWWELIDPRDGTSLDLAFIITPEPATLALLAAGGLGMLLRRRSR